MGWGCHCQEHYIYLLVGHCLSGLGSYGHYLRPDSSHYWCTYLWHIWFAGDDQCALGLFLSRRLCLAPLQRLPGGPWKKAAQFDPFKHLGVDEIWKWQVFSLNGDQLMPYQQDDHSCTRYSIFVSEIVSIGAGFWYILIAKVDYTFIYIYRIFYEFMLSIKSCDIYQCVTRSLRATMGRPSTPTESQRPRPVTGTVKNTVSHPLRHLHILQLQHTITYYILYIYNITHEKYGYTNH